MPKQKTIKIVDVEPPQEGQPDEQPEEQQEVVPAVGEVKETPPQAKSKARAKSKVRDATLVVAKDVELDFDTKNEPTIKANVQIVIKWYLRRHLNIATYTPVKLKKKL